MDKQCPHCEHGLTKQDYRQFLRKQVGEWMLCAKCEGKIYILVPENKRGKMMLQNIMVALPFLVLALIVAYVALVGGLSFFDVGADTARRDVKLLGIIFFGIIGALYFVLTMASRAIHWKLSVAQKSPFV